MKYVTGVFIFVCCVVFGAQGGSEATKGAPSALVAGVEKKMKPLISCAHFKLQHTRKNEIVGAANRLAQSLEKSSDWRQDYENLSILEHEAVANYSRDLADPALVVSVSLPMTAGELKASSIVVYRDGGLDLRLPLLESDIHIESEGAQARLLIPVRYYDICGTGELAVVIYRGLDITYSLNLKGAESKKISYTVDLSEAQRLTEELDGRLETVGTVADLSPGRYRFFNCRIEVQNVDITDEEGVIRSRGLRLYGRDLRYGNEASLTYHLENGRLNEVLSTEGDMQTMTQLMTIDGEDRISQTRLHRAYGAVKTLDLAEIRFNPYRVHRRVLCQPFKNRSQHE